MTIADALNATRRVICLATVPMLVPVKDRPKDATMPASNAVNQITLLATALREVTLVLLLVVVEGAEGATIAMKLGIFLAIAQSMFRHRLCERIFGSQRRPLMKSFLLEL